MRWVALQGGRILLGVSYKKKSLKLQPFLPIAVNKRLASNDY
jgi:hypothetical protein